MSSEKDGLLRRPRWHILVICSTVAVVAVLTWFTDVFQKYQTNLLRQLILIFGALVFLSALLAMLSRVFKILDALKDNSTKLEKVAGTLEAIGTELAQINHSTRVSETAKAIAFRDVDRQSLHTRFPA